MQNRNKDSFVEEQEDKKVEPQTVKPTEQPEPKKGPIVIVDAAVQI